jgi:hypothetical protein
MAAVLGFEEHLDAKLLDGRLEQNPPPEHRSAAPSAAT